MKRKFDKTTEIRLYYEYPYQAPTGFDWSAISDDAVNNTLDSLNDDTEGYRYSFEQVKGAMWRMLVNHIDDYLQDIEYHFDKCDKSELLGDPEVGVKEEQRLEKGDIEYDERRDR